VIKLRDARFIDAVKWFGELKQRRIDAAPEVCVVCLDDSVSSVSLEAQNPSEVSTIQVCLFHTLSLIEPIMHRGMSRSDAHMGFGRIAVLFLATAGRYTYVCKTDEDSEGQVWSHMGIV
jgi:hypothetical protein